MTEMMERLAGAVYAAYDDPKLQIDKAAEAKAVFDRERKHFLALLEAARMADSAAKGYLYGTLLVYAEKIENRCVSILREFNPARSWAVSQLGTDVSKFLTTVQGAKQEAHGVLGRGALHALGVSG